METPDVLKNIAPSTEADRALLESLGLDEDDLQQLSRHGFVASETTPSGRTAHKLRYRQCGQRIVWLGYDDDFAERVEEALDRWQGDRRIALALAKLRREAGRRLRVQLRRLEPLLRAAGYHLHNREIRKKRVSRKA